VGSHWTSFRNISYFEHSSEKTVEKKIQLLLKCDKDNGYLTSEHVYICDIISLNSSLNEEPYRKKKLQIKSKHEFYVQHFSSENRAFSELMWPKKKKKVRVGQATDDNTYGASAFHAG
jgi:hypothetical protein